MKFTVTSNPPERKLVAVIIGRFIYWKEGEKTVGRVGLFGPTAPIARSLEDLATDSRFIPIYAGDTLTVEF